MAHVLAVLPWVAVSAGAGGGGRPARCEEGRVLVVGAGLAGLGAADALRRHGCDVTVLEAGLLPGGTHTRRTARPPPPPAHSRCAPRRLLYWGLGSCSSSRPTKPPPRERKGRH